MWRNYRDLRMVCFLTGQYNLRPSTNGTGLDGVGLEEGKYRERKDWSEGGREGMKGGGNILWKEGRKEGGN